LPRIAAGDAEAVQDCLSRYGSLVWTLARKFTNSYEEAEDAVQEIFIDVWQHAARYDASKAAETTFIAMIARRRMIDRVRKIYRRPQTDSLENYFETGSADSLPALEIKLDNSLKAQEAMKAIRELRPEQRRLIALTVFDGLSHNEIAQRTGLPLGTVKTHIRRGLCKVREIMSRNTARQVRLAIA
jgi:RNA polymerase sigma-70 factor (ECF subfamily)